MTISGGLYETMVASAEAADKLISEALETTEGCKRNCPVCAAASGALEAMLEAVRVRRQTATETTLRDPQLGRDLTIATFSMIESFTAHAEFTLNLIRVAHEALDDMAEGRVNIMVASQSGDLREAAQDIIRRCDAADAAVKANSGKYGSN
jgi:pyruvate-formate lyase-activating enzyme